MSPILLNIKSITYAECSDIYNLLFIPGLGVKLPENASFQKLDIVNLAFAETISKYENKTRLFTTTVKAKLPEQFDVNNRHLIFILSTVNSERFLLGLPYHPYPIITTTFSMPENMAEPSGCTIIIEYTDNRDF